MLFCRDDHGFSPLHWACREGRSSVVDMLIMRGARINVMNRGDDTPLHLAASHGHRDIVGKVELAQTSNKMNISHCSHIDLIAKPASRKELKTNWVLLCLSFNRHFTLVSFSTYKNVTFSRISSKYLEMLSMFLISYKMSEIESEIDSRYV